MPVKDLETTIIQWETDVRMFEEACAPEIMTEQNKRMFVENMCPDRLKDHLAAHGPRISSWDLLRMEISDWVQKELERSARHPKAAALEATSWPDSAAQEDYSEYDEADGAEFVEQFGALVEQFPQLNAVSAEISAIVKSKFGKKGGAKSGGGKGAGDSAESGGGKAGGGGKGKGGKGKDGKGTGKERRCFECDGTDHLAAECPVRKSRVAAGGPERLPKGKGKQTWYPSARQWNGWNPMPPGAWNQWRPQAPGKGNPGAAMVQSPL